MKIRNTNDRVVSKKILQIDKKKNQIIKIWNSLGDIGRYFKNSKSNISKVCNGIRFSACGWRWKYANS